MSDHEQATAPDGFAAKVLGSAAYTVMVLMNIEGASFLGYQAGPGPCGLPPLVTGARTRLARTGAGGCASNRRALHGRGHPGLDARTFRTCTPRPRRLHSPRPDQTV